MVNFPTRIPDCDSHSTALLDLFLSSNASISSAMAFPPLGNSDHVVVSVSFDFPSNSQQDAPFHRIAYDYSRADWDGLRNHLRDVTWRIFFNSVLLLLLGNFVSGFRLELMYICKFTQTSNRCKRVLEAAKLAYANKLKESITSQKLGSWDFWRIANSVLNKGKSAIPPLFNGLEVLVSASDKAKNFKNSNLYDTGISLTVFLPRTNLKLHNVSVTPKMVKKVITNLDCIQW